MDWECRLTCCSEMSPGLHHNVTNLHVIGLLDGVSESHLVFRKKRTLTWSIYVSSLLLFFSYIIVDITLDINSTRIVWKSGGNCNLSKLPVCQNCYYVFTMELNSWLSAALIATDGWSNVAQQQCSKRFTESGRGVRPFWYGLIWPACRRIHNEKESNHKHVIVFCTVL